MKIHVGLFDVGRRPNEKPAAGGFFLGGALLIKTVIFFLFHNCCLTPNIIK